MDTTIIIILIIILVILGIIALYIGVYNKLQKNLIRINESESLIDECLRKKIDILSTMESIINEQTNLNQDNFSEFKNDEMSNFEVDRKLTKITETFNKIKLDYEKELNYKAYKESLIELKKNNEICDASKSFYNKYTTDLNMLVKKFPTNIVAKLHGINSRLYFDNKNMEDENIFDFKI